MRNGWFSSGSNGHHGGNWFRGPDRENDCKLFLLDLDKDASRYNLKVKKVTRTDKPDVIEIRIDYEEIKK